MHLKTLIQLSLDRGPLHHISQIFQKNGLL